MFDSLPPVPDSNALELEVLERWEREGTFRQLRDRNRGGPKWSFIDGPVTANKALAHLPALLRDRLKAKLAAKAQNFLSFHYSKKKAIN